MPKVFLALIFAAGVALLGAGYYLHTKKDAPRPNVVFLLLDTFRADLIGATRGGQPVTPFLNSFAQQSLQFMNAISPSSLTRPSMASIMSATDVFSNQVFHSVDSPADKDAADVLDDKLETLAEYLGAHGYDNWEMQTNVNAAAEIGMAQGVPADHYKFISRAPAAICTKNALGMARNAKGSFFLFIQFLDTHGPYHPPAEFAEVFGPPPAALTPDERNMLSPENFTTYLYDRLRTYTGQQAANTMPDLTPAGVEWLHQRYDASARYLDDEIGKMIGTLQAAWPNTIFVIMADHGEEIYDRGLLGHGHTLYQELLHVPFMIQGPGIPPRTVDAHVPTHAILPTLAELLALPKREQWETRSILHASGPDAEPVYSLTRAGGADLKINLESAIQGNTKIIWNRNTDEIRRFDLASDTGEKSAVVADAADAESQRLKEAILARHAATGTKGDGKGRPAASAAAPISEETRKQLIELGYDPSREK